ncbi:hypothetical protein SAMN02745866_01448 [Alteromonadaceae bacterium Bs31]|nr:hypothetical protein SAMN02745866_01448 [Alteromonadaceae bacterium Bs31]
MNILISRYGGFTLFFTVLCLCVSTIAVAQDVEPRRWTPLPVGAHVIGAGYAYTTGDIAFDPALKIESATVDVQTVGVSYVKPFAIGNNLARIDALLPLQQAHWDGMLDGSEASVQRSGLADPRLRFSMNLLGAPVASRAGLQRYFVDHPVNTQVGIAIALGLPLGQYDKTKLLNLGQNRYMVQPQLGLLHSRGQWSYELTASAYFFTENKAFFNGNTREQDNIYELQGHVIRRFTGGYWLSASLAKGRGGQSTISGVKKDDDRSNSAYALSMGMPVSKAQSLKLVYLYGETHRRTGSDLGTLGITWAKMF